jgi:putative ABC transport system substrate-binding protein
MRELGYAEGRDYSVEDRYGDNNFARLDELAAVLVRLKPDVIVCAGTAAVLAAKKATADIAIVGATMTDPIGFGLIASEARPGTNVTGILARIDGLPGKQVEIARDLIPAATTIAVLVNVNDPGTLRQQSELETAAASVGATLLTGETRGPDDIGPAFQRFARQGAMVVIVPGDATFLSQRRQIAAFALSQRLPTVHSFREHVEDGGLLSYGIDLRANYRRAAYYVDRILKGDKPADLPVEFPTKLEMVVNQTTAKALGLAIPPSIMVRVDEVIE